MDNYHQSLDLLHVGDNSRFDVFIKSIQLELILETDFFNVEKKNVLLSLHIVIAWLNKEVNTPMSLAVNINSTQGFKSLNLDSNNF